MFLKHRPWLWFTAGAGCNERRCGGTRGRNWTRCDGGAVDHRVQGSLQSEKIVSLLVGQTPKSSHHFHKRECSSTANDLLDFRPQLATEPRLFLPVEGHTGDASD